MSKRDELIAIAKGKRPGYWIERYRGENGRPDVFCLRTPNERVTPMLLYEWDGIAVDSEYLGIPKEQAYSFPVYDHQDGIDERWCLIVPVGIMKCLFDIRDEQERKQK